MKGIARRRGDNTLRHKFNVVNTKLFGIDYIFPCDQNDLNQASRRDLMTTGSGTSSSRIRRKKAAPVKVVGQARAQKTRDAILRAATKVFSTHGFAGGTIEQISKLSRTHDRMIYYYFGNKEKLFVEVLETAYARMNEAEAELAFNLDDPRQALTTVVHFVWQYYLDHPEMIALLNSENLQKGKHIKKSGRVSKLSSPAVDILEQVLNAGITKGLFRDDISARNLYIEIAALGYFYLSNHYTLSAFLNVELRSTRNLADWKTFITDITLRSVGRLHDNNATETSGFSSCVLTPAISTPPL